MFQDLKVSSANHRALKRRWNWPSVFLVHRRTFSSQVSPVQVRKLSHVQCMNSVIRKTDHLSRSTVLRFLKIFLNQNCSVTLKVPSPELTIKKWVFSKRPTKERCSWMKSVIFHFHS